MEYYFSSLPPPFLLSRRWLLLSLAALLSYLLLCFTLHRIFPAPNAIAIASLSFPRPQGELDSTPLPPAPQVSHLAPTANFPGNGSGKESAEEKCNLFEGRWVHDPRWYPLYRSQRCPFLSDQVSCQRSGRPDSDYERWRWQPNGCDLPRFNGSETLERWRGKRVVVVGDSLNRNMWESMICMLYSAARRKRVYVKNRSAEPKLFRALDHDCTVEFFWSPFLVELKEREGDRAKILHLDNLPASARFWRGADVMVFNTGHWWTHHGKMRAWDYFQIREELTEEMEPAEAFNRALRTWARWVDSNVDPRQTSVFFRSISPEHKR
ncbi:protein trichome birefringence-like 36 [Zingiber officinale]|nr:protein trichome birefringence-like 36 [Zingiber officinale]